MTLGGMIQAQAQTSTATPAPSSNQPAPTSAPPSAASNPTTAAASTTAAEPATPSPDVLRKARAEGFKPEVRDGVTKYCIKDEKAETGSHFAAPKHCYDESQMLAIVAQRQQDRDTLRGMHENNISSK